MAGFFYGICNPLIWQNRKKLSLTWKIDRVFTVFVWISRILFNFFLSGFPVFLFGFHLDLMVMFTALCK
jgi:hypothetical protein